MAAKRVAVQACVQHAECALCLEALCEKKLGVTVDHNGRRTCRHFFHFDCLTEFVNHIETVTAMVCPLCNSCFDSVLQMPDPQAEPGTWFHYVDADDSGALSKEEIVDVARALCDVDEERIEGIVQQKYEAWAKDETHGVDKSEFKDVLDFIFENLPEGPEVRDVPDITRPGGLKKWFEHWDMDGNGVIDKSELCRALIKTFDIGAGTRRLRIIELHDVVDTIWPLFDPDKSETITKEEFLLKDGLADTILAGLEVQKMIPEDDGEGGEAAED